MGNSDIGDTQIDIFDNHGTRRGRHARRALGDIDALDRMVLSLLVFK